ncbi:MAG TPA: hypothetical protein ENJ09_04290 [Planctomycetes bacterium]|nr:hypothetical protein [Planctomycetota bacterium]
MESTTQGKRRKYTRRTPEERIKELEARILEIKTREASRQKREDPVIKEIPKVQRRLRKFAQMAMDHNRPDIANTVTAFNAGLERILRSETRRSAPATPPIEELMDDRA